MNAHLLLQDITIIDLTQRLPGPLAGKILQDLGAKVIKIENTSYPDPFLSPSLRAVDESFYHWYQELNRGKESLRLDFANHSHIRQIRELIKDSQGLLLGIPCSQIEILQLTQKKLEEIPASLGVIQLMAGHKQEDSLHDLNALAQTGLLSLYVADKNEKILSPPFLPFAGMAFGQWVASQLLAAILRSQREQKVIYKSTSLLETLEKTFSPFWPPSLQKITTTTEFKYLHNGAFPCYGLYQTSDGHYVAVATVEEKFWSRFCDLFGLKMAPEERFRRDFKYFSLIAEKLNRLTADEVANMLNGQNICVSVVKKIKQD